MRRLRNLWGRARALYRSEAAGDLPPSENLRELIATAAFADLEQRLEVWARWGTPRESHEPSKEFAIVSQRVEEELQRIFGQEALRGIQSTCQSSNGTIVFAADRLFVEFLGRSAAMAVTRKLYSRLT